MSDLVKYISVVVKRVKSVTLEKLYGAHDQSRYLSTISVKNFYIFKIAKLVFSFYLKLYNFKQMRVFY